MQKRKLAILTSHPIQYQVPLFRKLACSDEVKPMVYFCSDLGLGNKIDAEFGIAVKWDTPLLDGYEYRFLKNYPMSSKASRFGAFVNPGIIQEILANQFDAIFIHGYGVATNWLAFGTSIAKRLPILLHGETMLHRNRSSFFRYMKKQALISLFKQIRAFLYIGTNSMQFYKEFGVKDEKLFFSPYSVNNDFFLEQSKVCSLERNRLRQTLGIDENEAVILCVSKLYQGKRPLDAIRAFEKLQGKATLVFVGDGEQRVFLENYVQEKKLGKVHFLGFKNQSELPQYYAMADVFILPSASERWGLVINEAMCFGLPIVTTEAVSCAADLVRQGENGYVHAVGDVESLAKQLQSLIQDPSIRKRMGEHSLKLISNWNYERCVHGIVEALDFVSKKENTWEKNQLAL